MIPTTDPTATLALDARSLDALRLQAKQNPQGALKAAAQQFEALFLQQLLKSMRDATPQDGPLDSQQTRSYTAMFDQQLAQTLSARGIGLADLMLRQLARNGAAPAAAAAAQPGAALETGATAAARADESDAIAPQSAATGANAPASAASGPSSADAFLARMKRHALDASRATGIPARFLLGHAALESGWGKHEIRAADGSRSFNLFGVKAGRNWNGATVDAMTTEYVAGKPQRVMQKFRAYDSYAAAFSDYANLLRASPRYAAVLNRSDSAGFARGLQRAGYATDPQYADKLTRILNGARMRRTIMA